MSVSSDSGVDEKMSKEDRSAADNADEDNSEPEYIVESILDKRKSGGVWKYFVKWEGWPDYTNTWEPVQNLTGCEEKLRHFEQGWNAKRKEERAAAKKRASEDRKLKEEEEGKEESTAADGGGGEPSKKVRKIEQQGAAGTTGGAAAPVVKKKAKRRYIGAGGGRRRKGRGGNRSKAAAAAAVAIPDPDTDIANTEEKESAANPVIAVDTSPADKVENSEPEPPSTSEEVPIPPAIAI